MTMLPNTERFASPSDSMDRIDSPDCAPIFETEPAQEFVRFTPARAFTILATYLKTVHNRVAVKGHIREDGDIVISLKPVGPTPYATTCPPPVCLLREAMGVRNAVFDLASPRLVISKEERAIAIEWRKRAFDKLAREGIDVRKNSVLSFDDDQLRRIAMAYSQALKRINLEVSILRGKPGVITNEKIATPSKIEGRPRAADGDAGMQATASKSPLEYWPWTNAEIIEREKLFANLYSARVVWENFGLVANALDVQVALQRWPKAVERKLSRDELLADAYAFTQAVLRYQCGEGPAVKTPDEDGGDEI